MAGFIKPIIHAFLVCDTIIIDSLTGKKSIIGAFTHLWAKTFPCQHPQVGVYFSLTDAEGKYAFDIQLVYLDQDQIVGKGSLPPIEISNRLGSVKKQLCTVKAELQHNRAPMEDPWLCGGA